MRIWLRRRQRRKRSHSAGALHFRKLLLQHPLLLFQIDASESRNLPPKPFQVLLHELAISTLPTAWNVQRALFPSLLTYLLELTTGCSSDGPEIDSEVLLLLPPVRKRHRTLLRRERKRRQARIPVQAQLPTHLLSGIKLHATNPGEHSRSPRPETLLQIPDSTRTQFFEERSGHGMHEPQVDVRMNAAATLRLNGAEIRADETKRTRRAGSGNAVRNTRGTTLRLDTDDVLEEQF